MPSLPELEVYRTEFTNQLAGQTVTAFEALDYRVVRADNESLTRHLVGNSIQNVARYGKWLMFDLGLPEQLIFHLGLTGKLHVQSPDDQLPRYSCLTLDFEGAGRLVMSDQRHLGKIYVRNFDELKTEKELGPDQFSVTRDYFVTTLRRKRRGARDVLMDQRILAGVGGKYADEVLWQAKLHPNTKLDRLSDDELGALYDTLMRVTAQAIELGADPERFPDGWLIPHRRTDQRCPHCGVELTARKLGGSETFYCPHDQPAPNPYRKG